MKTFIFDLDDTLIYNQYHYTMPQIKLCEYILKKIYPNHEELKIAKKMLNLNRVEILYKTIDRIFEKFNNPVFMKSVLDKEIEFDVKNVERNIKTEVNPFSCERFPEAFILTFEYFCKLYNKPYSKKELEIIRNFGFETYFVRKDFIPGAEEVLDFLKSKGDELILLTKGDREWQDKKIKAHKLDKWFNEIFIVDNKTSSFLEELVEGRDRSRIYKVGNSLRSDVNPALKAGINAVYIPFETWMYERAGNIEQGNVFKFSCLSELIKNYDNLLKDYRELNEFQKKLVVLAKESRKEAYAPYSGYKVGASLLSSEGHFYSACNVESSTYTLTNHAETAAIDAMIAAGDKKIKAFAIVIDNYLGPPCGICSQKISEFAEDNMEIVSCNLEGAARIYRINEVLPFAFGKNHLR